MGIKRKPRKLSTKSVMRPLLIKEGPERQFRNGYDDSVLKRVLTNLSKMRRKELRSKLYCQSESLKENNVDLDVRLRCRQLPIVVQQLRKAILSQDWDQVTTLLIILCHPGLKHYSSIIMKVCFILLFNHSNSSTSLLRNFTRHVTEYILDEDVNKFIRILFALRKSALMPLKIGQYIRKTGDYKVARDPEFEKL